MFQDVVVRRIYEHRGRPRLYLDFPDLERASFAPRTVFEVRVDTERGQLVLVPNPEGDRIVSSKLKNNRLVPVIDVNSQKALALFEGVDQVRIVLMKDRIFVMPLASALAQRERLQRLMQKMEHSESLAMASLSHGIGVMSHAAHEGLADAGVGSHAAVVNEIDERLMEQSRRHNDVWREGTIGLTAPMQEVVQDPYVMSRLPAVEVLEAGIPCSGASKAGKSKRSLAAMEAHPTVGHLVAPAIMLLQKLQPAVAVIENVPDYAFSGSAHILRGMLRDMGYEVQELELDASEFGCLEARRRWFLVASTRGVQIDLTDLAPRLHAARRLGDVLDDVAENDPRWMPFAYLKEKAVRDREAGKGFKMQCVTADDASVPSLRRGYYKGGTCDPLLVHPTDPDLLRKFTVAEHCRIKEVPAHLVSETCESDGHQMLGQGVAYVPVQKLFHRIGECLIAAYRAWKEKPARECIAGQYLLKGTG